jgi:hypothetical protein
VRPNANSFFGGILLWLEDRRSEGGSRDFVRDELVMHRIIVDGYFFGVMRRSEKDRNILKFDEL